MSGIEMGLVALAGIGILVIVVKAVMSSAPSVAARIDPRSYDRFAGWPQQRGEEWDAYTPVPNAWDSFACACGALWRRVDDGCDYHRLRDGSICDGPLSVKYINPPYAERPSLDPKPAPSQGATR